MHLLNLSFVLAVSKRVNDDPDLATSICTKQLTGIAGVAAERIRRALNLSADVDGLTAVLRMHPLLNPAGYIDADIDKGRLHVRRSPAHDDGAWISLCGPDATGPVQAIATAVDPHLRVRVGGPADDWTAVFDRIDTALPECPEVQVTKVSRGAAFVFEPRRALPLTVLR